MERLKCPICNKRIDVTLVPFDKVQGDCLIVCENEYYTHGICHNGASVLFRQTNSMVNELFRNNIKDNY